MSGRLTGTYWLALAVLLALLAAYAHQRHLVSRHAEYEQSKQTVKDLQQQAEVLQKEEIRLRQRVERLDTDPVELEAAIRHNRNLVRKGETVYRIELEPE